MVQKWLGYAEVVEVCGSICGVWWAPEQNLVEIGAKNGAVDGDVAARGRMSGWGQMSGLYGPDVRALDPGTNG